MRSIVIAHPCPYTQARFLESPRRAWNECGLASRALVVAASPFFATGVAFKCEAKVKPDNPLHRHTHPRARGVPICYMHMQRILHMHAMHMCMLHAHVHVHVHAHVVTDQTPPA